MWRLALFIKMCYYLIVRERGNHEEVLGKRSRRKARLPAWCKLCSRLWHATRRRKLCLWLHVQPLERMPKSCNHYGRKPKHHQRVWWVDFVKIRGSRTRGIFFVVSSCRGILKIEQMFVFKSGDRAGARCGEFVEVLTQSPQTFIMYLVGYPRERRKNDQKVLHGSWHRNSRWCSRALWCGVGNCWPWG